MRAFIPGLGEFCIGSGRQMSSRWMCLWKTRECSPTVRQQYARIEKASHVLRTRLDEMSLVSCEIISGRINRMSWMRIVQCNCKYCHSNVSKLLLSYFFYGSGSVLMRLGLIMTLCSMNVERMWENSYGFSARRVFMVKFVFDGIGVIFRTADNLVVIWYKFVFNKS